jgi:hypothetical protein
MKHRVLSLPDGTTKYSVKLWPGNEAEPSNWDLEAVEDDSDLQSGCVLLLAHNSDVTFGNVKIVPLNDAKILFAIR